MRALPIASLGLDFDRALTLSLAGSQAALRRSIPSFNDHVASLQRELEAVQYALRIPQRKPWQSMASSAAAAIDLVADGDSCLRGVLPADIDAARGLLEGIGSDLTRLQRAIDVKDPERTSVRVSNALERLSQIELLQSPGLKYQVPRRYASLPRLTGRAILEMTVTPQTGGGTKRLELTLDGFSAPLTSGRVLSNVLKKMYDGTVVRVDDTAVFVGGGRGSGGGDADADGQLPLEIMARGEYEPRYRAELDVNSGEIPLLPLSVDGALAMARAGDGMSSTSEWFIYKYNRATSGLAGVSFDDGRFAVYGYCSDDTSGGGLRSLGDGDRIESIRVLAGADKLLNDGQEAISGDLS